MIGYLEGKVVDKQEDRILLLVNHVGYEVLVPPMVMAELLAKPGDEEVGLYIFYQQTERQPKPVLIGFSTSIEKEFFQLLIKVEAIGPLKAVKALTRPMGEIAAAIENRDHKALAGLKGIGKRTAQKIVATLEGKMGKFALARDKTPEPPSAVEGIADQVLQVLVAQLGYKEPDARRLVGEALERNPAVVTAEELFDEVYRGQQT